MARLQPLTMNRSLCTVQEKIIHVMYRFLELYCTVLFMPVLRLYAVVVLHEHHHGLVYRFVGGFGFVLVILCALMHALLLFNILPPPWSLSITARAHGRLDALWVLVRCAVCYIPLTEALALVWAPCGDERG